MHEVNLLFENDYHMQDHEMLFESKHTDRARIENDSFLDSPQQRTLTTVIINDLSRFILSLAIAWTIFLSKIPVNQLQIPIARSKINIDLEKCAAIAQFRKVPDSPQKQFKIMPLLPWFNVHFLTHA